MKKDRKIFEFFKHNNTLNGSINQKLLKDNVTMRILANDVAAENSGALIILESFYQQFTKDTSNKYIFCVSKPIFKSTSNIEVLSFPWVKRSWLHRLWFEIVTANRLINRYNIDEIFSLQNVVIPFTKKPQILYLHQSLPFEEKRFALFEAPLFWVYQNIIGPLIIYSAKRAKKVIVQTKWMKEALKKMAKLPDEKIEVQPPELSIEIPGQFSSTDWERLFFYPATSHLHKNHITLLKAMKILKEKGIQNYQVLLTTSKQELPRECKYIVDEFSENITFLGSIPHQKVIEIYCKTVLVFPSYMETYGLPLKEASLCRAPIIAADRPFSREILSEYTTKSYFPSFDADSLAECMKAYLDAETSEVET